MASGTTLLSEKVQVFLAVALCTWFQIAIIHMPNVDSRTTLLLHSGRAGNKGTAITFISPEEDQYAGDLVKALKESKAPIPEDLLTMAKEHAEKVKRGEARAHGSGYGGSGFKFDSAEEDKEKDRRKVNCCAETVLGQYCRNEQLDQRNQVRLAVCCSPCFVNIVGCCLNTRDSPAASPIASKGKTNNA